MTRCATLLQIYPHGSGDLNALDLDHPEIVPQIHTRVPNRNFPMSLDPTSYVLTEEAEGRIHSKAYPVSGSLLSRSPLARVQFPRVHAPVTSAPAWPVDPVEGRIRGGLPKVSSHPENLGHLSEMAAANGAIASPFAR